MMGLNFFAKVCVVVVLCALRAIYYIYNSNICTSVGFQLPCFFKISSN